MIHPDTGRITVARYLDADKHDRVILNVQARDLLRADLVNGGSNHTQVVILVEDHNDNSPRFPIDMVEITVSENQTVHEPFYIVHATDKDKRKAQDHGIPPRSTNMTLVIHVSDFNDNAPVFETTSYEAEVAENSPLMTAVLKVKARDADSRENGKVLYRITNGSSAFGIDEKTGMIYVNENIDREVQSVYSIVVTAQDQGEQFWQFPMDLFQPSLSSSVPVRIHITDVNDNAPSCNSVATMVVPLDSTPATTVGTVVITDRDSGLNGTVVYRSQQSHPLFVVKSNGDAQLRRPLTESDPTDVRLSVIASDQGTPRKSTVCHVQIRIGRGTSAVKIVEPFERNIRMPSSCQPGCFLRQLNATGVAKWQIQSNDISNHFSINDGKLSMTSHPQTPPPWSLSLILSDKEGRQKHLSIKVLESNSASSHFELDQATGDIYLVRKIRDLEGRQMSLHYSRIDALTSESEAKQIDFEVGSGSVDAPYFNEDVMRVTVAEDAVIGWCCPYSLTVFV
ncbi:cadherin domain protein [Ancylostoma duodenale]|uniref:Cadherin domain protein n=1 Tax=Ancylostoma duodenale TaxID=51022 RepID=A0A0C2GT13_9BILA|nr:cadherin domain protein [Ancylostoma duodenale]